MTIKELEQQPERLADADLDAGGLDAAVMKLGQLAAIELMAEEAAREPAALAPDAAPEAQERWSGAVERAREQAQAELEDAPALWDADVVEEPASRLVVLLPLVALGLLIVALLLIFGAGRAFDLATAGLDR